MAINLKNITMYMFRTIYEREDTYNKFKPYFYRFIGVEDSSNYDNYIKTIQNKCLEEDKCIIFDGYIPLSGEMELIQYIFNELAFMDVYKMSSQEITIFEEFEINLKFLKALEYVIPMACNKENFFNDNVRNNFITKLIVWTYTYAKNIKYDSSINPKCIYYGNIERHEIYFLIMLYKMGYDVIYINPLKEEFWSEIEEDRLSECIKSMGILSIESFNERASKGKAIDNFDLSYGLKLSTYAVPLIVGEIKRYLRDNTAVRISRSTKDLAYKIIKFKEQYLSDYGVEAPANVIAEALNIPEYLVGYAMDAMRDPASIFEPIYNDGGDTIYLFDQIADVKDKNSDKDMIISLRRALLKIKEREKNILLQRFMIGKTQMEIADELGISQAQVSRLAKSAIENVRKLIK